MKKYIAIFLAILVMSFCLSFAVSAEVDCFTLSEDLMSLSLNGQTYVRMDTSSTIFYSSYTIEQEPQWSQEQQEQFVDWSFCLSDDGYAVEATFHYRAGGILYCTYVLEEFAPKLEAYQKGEGADCRIEIELTPIIIPEARLKGQPTTLSSDTLEDINQYDVYSDVTDEYFYIRTGTLLSHQGTFYYVDHSELTRYDGYIDPYEYETLACYQITDQELIQQLRGFGLSDNTMEFLFELGLGIMIILIFGAVPAGILVLGLIFMAKRKGYYKVTWGITAVFCVAELITFVTVLVNLNW